MAAACASGEAIAAPLLPPPDGQPVSKLYDGFPGQAASMSPSCVRIWLPALPAETPASK